MVKEIQKEVADNIDRLIQKTRKLSVKLFSFVISCWLIIGTVGIGLVAPVYVVKSLMKIQWTGGVHASVSSEQKLVAANPRPMSRPGWYQIDDRYLMRSKLPGRNPTLGEGLRDTTNTVSEFRRLVNGFASFVNR